MGVETLIFGIVFNIYTLDNIDFFHQRANNNKTMNCRWEYVGKTKADPSNASITLLGNVFYKQKCVTKELDK